MRADFIARQKQMIKHEVNRVIAMIKHGKAQSESLTKTRIKTRVYIDSEARVIVSSGYADDPVMANYAELGFKGIATKPYTKSKLMEVLSQVLEK